MYCPEAVVFSRIEVETHVSASGIVLAVWPFGAVLEGFGGGWFFTVFLIGRAVGRNSMTFMKMRLGALGERRFLGLGLAFIFLLGVKARLSFLFLHIR